MKWRASRNEGIWSGPRVEDKSVLPLTYAPGTGFSYGAGHDWSGRAVEVATSCVVAPRVSVEPAATRPPRHITSFCPQSFDAIRSS